MLRSSRRRAHSTYRMCRNRQITNPKTTWNAAWFQPRYSRYRKYSSDTLDFNSYHSRTMFGVFHHQRCWYCHTLNAATMNAVCQHCSSLRCELKETSCWKYSTAAYLMIKQRCVLWLLAYAGAYFYAIDRVYLHRRNRNHGRK